MDLIDQLRIFIRVTHGGGFNVAAAQMGLPRPTVSLAIKQLESRLGVRLLNRTTRRMSLTQDGASLLEGASLLVADAENLQQQFRPQGQVLTGRLKVDIPSRIARRLVAPVLSTFLTRHPRVIVELGSSDRAVDLVGEGVDCALRVGELPVSSLVARPLGHLRLVNCASPAYLARRGTPQIPGDLAGHRAVNYAVAGAARIAPWQWREAGQLHTRELDGSVTVNNAETYIACCVSGLGLIQVPAFDVQDHLANGELVEVLHDWPAPAAPVQLVYPHRRHLSLRIKAFGEWLGEVLAPHLI